MRKYIIAFGTLFNDINISRTDSESANTHFIKVPISYAPKEKVLARMDADPDISRPTALQLPRMSFEMITMTYDENRQLPATIKNIKRDSANTSLLRYQYVGVPYNFKFQLNVYVKNAEDGTKILEQIIPFFRPSFTPSLDLIEEMGEMKDTPITLDSIETIDTYTERFEQRRAIIHTLDFTLEGYLWGPVIKSTVIKFANVTFENALTENIRDSIGNSAPLERVIVRAGLTANGEPTSNIEITVPLSEIDIEDDWGYITIIENL